MHDCDSTKFRLTILGGMCGGLAGTLLASLSWLTTRLFLWYAWVFSPLMLCLFGVAIVEWWNRSRWFEQTPVHRQFTGLLGENFGRIGVLVFLVLFSMGGIAIGAMPWLASSRSSEAYRIDGFRHDAKYYSQLLLELKSTDETAKTIALSKISGDNSAPKIDVSELRMAMFSIAEDANEDRFVREMAVKALGRAGLADDIPRLEAMMEKSKGVEQERGIVNCCETSIDELRNPSKYRWNP